MKRNDLKGLVNLPNLEKRPTQIALRRFPIVPFFLCAFLIRIPLTRTRRRVFVGPLVRPPALAAMGFVMFSDGKHDVMGFVMFSSCCVRQPSTLDIQIMMTF